MGKVQKNKNKNSNRHSPLHQEISDDRYTAHSPARNKVRSKHPTEDTFVDSRLSSKMLKQVCEQKEEIEKEITFSDSNATVLSSVGSSDPSQDERDNDDEFSSFSGTDSLDEIKISEDEEKTFKNFMAKDLKKRVTLSEIIKETLTEKRTAVGSEAFSGMNEEAEENMSLYKNLAPLLKDFSSGKLPAYFKCMPNFSNWKQLLCLTEPDNWSDATMCYATQIFCSNVEDKKAQWFFSHILLSRLRDKIAETKTLNTQLYKALKEVLYKPAAFFKGLILPLCQAGNCELREAVIFGNILAECSVPLLHSSAALLTIAEMEYSGVNTIFMRVLLEKKYPLPQRVVNAIVTHFLRFTDNRTEYVSYWLRCLLTFVQIYKIDLSVEQKTELLQLMNVYHVYPITDIIRSELQTINYGNLSLYMGMDSKSSN